VVRPNLGHRRRQLVRASLAGRPSRLRAEARRKGWVRARCGGASRMTFVALRPSARGHGRRAAPKPGGLSCCPGRGEATRVTSVLPDKNRGFGVPRSRSFQVAAPAGRGRRPLPWITCARAPSEPPAQETDRIWSSRTYSSVCGRLSGSCRPKPRASSSDLPAHDRPRSSSPTGVCWRERELPESPRQRRGPPCSAENLDSPERPPLRPWRLTDP